MEPAHRERFSVLIACPGCRRTGAAIWEEYDRPIPVEGVQPALIELTAGFMQNVGKTATGDPIVSCGCGERFAI
jgi:hypothetical protein